MHPGQKPDRVCFVRIDAEGGLTQHQVLRCSLGKDGRFDLLDAKPGACAAEAAFRTRSALPFGTAPGAGVSVAIGRTGYTTYFASELIDNIKVEVGSGGFACMGRYRVRQSVGLQGAESLQLHCAELFSAGVSKSGAGHLLAGDCHLQGAALGTERAADARTEFIGKAQGGLAGSEWQQVLEQAFAACIRACRRTAAEAQAGRVGMMRRQAARTDDACPCGSGNAHAACCGRWHSGAMHLMAPTPQLLMRSRYSACVLGLHGYLLDSWHPTTRPAAIDPQPPDLRWLGLELRAERLLDANQATVEFVARSKLEGRAHRLHETSVFERVDGRWFYVRALEKAAP